MTDRIINEMLLSQASSVRSHFPAAGVELNVLQLMDNEQMRERICCESYFTTLLETINLIIEPGCHSIGVIEKHLQSFSLLSTLTKN